MTLFGWLIWLPLVLVMVNASPQVEIARGKLTVVCVTRDAAGEMAAIPIPRTIADKIEVAPAELLV